MVKLDFGGKHPPYVEQLQFTPATANVLFPDKPIVAGSPMRKVPATEGTVAEIPSFVFAVDINQNSCGCRSAEKEGWSARDGLCKNAAHSTWR